MRKDNMQNEVGVKRNYEISFWLSPELNDDKLEESFSKIKETIIKLGGTVGLSQLPQLKQLAYPIKKERNGYFGYFQFTINSGLLREVKKELDKNDSLLRYLIVYVPFENKQTKVKNPSRIHISKVAKKQPQTKEPSEIDMKDLDKKLNEILK